MQENIIGRGADRLEAAERDRVAVEPLLDLIPAGDVDFAYRVQDELVRRGQARGRRLIGRKIGLTSKAVQTQLGVDQPDFGALFNDMEVRHDGVCDAAALIQPRVEAEIALVLGDDLADPDLGIVTLLRALEFALPALEIVDSRIREWKISIVDTIADNGSSARFVLGLEPRSLTDLDLLTAGMRMTCDGETVSVGSGAACLGHPLNAALWLARTMARRGAPLRAGDVILTGALGPMVSARAGQRFEATIAGFAPVSVQFR